MTMKFNTSRTQTPTPSNPSSNHEGGPAYRGSPERELYQTVINNLVEQTYYRDETGAIDDVRAAVDRLLESGDDPEFVLQLAAHARREMGLRTIPQVLLVLAARDDRTKEYVREWTPSICQRADEPAETIAIHNAFVGERRALPKPLKKGLADALHQFDAYQFAKYSGDRREVSMVDVLNRVHPTPRDDERAEIFERVVKGDLDDYPDVEPLDPPETWEVMISECGSNRGAWLEVLPRMGHFAKVRNLRNILEAGVEPDTLVDHLDIGAVHRSQVYPFRYYQARCALEDAAGLGSERSRLLTVGRTRTLSPGQIEPVIDWLEAAIQTAVINVPDSLGRSFVAVDLSGSMDSTLSSGSAMTYMELAAFFGAICQSKGAAAGAFADSFEVVPAAVAANDSICEQTDRILELSDQVGGSTNGWKAIEFLREEELEVDRVVILTDLQIWDSSSRSLFGSRTSERRTVRDEWRRYRETVAPDAHLYMLDLSSYGDLSTPDDEPGVYNLSGWNERVLEFVELVESPGDILEAIAATEPDPRPGTV